MDEFRTKIKNLDIDLKRKSLLIFLQYCKILVLDEISVKNMNFKVNEEQEKNGKIEEFVELPPYLNDDDDWDFEDGEDDECELCHGNSDYAYQGLGFACLEVGCEHWGGDSLCMLTIGEQVKDKEEYEKLHIKKVKCPICKKKLDQFDIMGKEIFTWNAGFYDPILALEIIGALWLKKGVYHSKGSIYHIWVEFGDGIQERLIRMLTEKEYQKEFTKKREKLRKKRKEVEICPLLCPNCN